MRLPPWVRSGSFVAALVASLLCVAHADAKKPKRAEAREQADGKKGVASVGAPNRGRLDGGVRLKKSGHLKVREGSHSWGLPQLTKALHHAADRVAAKHKGSVLLVGDLSARHGGPLTGHNSHQTGRDADVGFYVTNSHGKGVVMSRFVAFKGDGTAKDVAWARFDDERNWRLVEALLEDPKASVRYIFVSTPLKTRLLRYAASKKVSRDLLTRAAAAMMAPDHADVHDDHFHVRIACPESMRGECIEESTTGGAGDDAEKSEPAEHAPEPGVAEPEAAAAAPPTERAPAPAPPAEKAAPSAPEPPSTGSAPAPF